MRRGFWPKLRRHAAQLPFAEDLVAAYYCALDRRTPRRVQVILLGALAYFVLPFDFIPDMLPIIGFTDDAAVLATAIQVVAAHITPEHRDAARRLLARRAGDRRYARASELKRPAAGSATGRCGSAFLRNRVIMRRTALTLPLC